MYKDFLRILKDSLEQKKSEYKDIDYYQLYHLSNNHHVVSLIYNNIYTNEGLAGELKSNWKKTTLTSVASQALRSQVFLDVYKDFIKEGLKVAVIKGIVLRYLYPEPDFRPSNDEDIYVQSKDLNQIIDIFLKHNFVVILQKEEVITVYDKYSGLCVEVHTSLFDKESEFFCKYQLYFNDIFDSLIKIDIKNNCVYSLSHEHHFLFLSFHLIKHILHSGIGIRQIIDICMYYKYYKNEMNFKYIYDVYADNKIDYVMDNIFSFLKDYFDLEDSYIKDIYTYTDMYEELIDDILESGLYGKSSMERIHSANMTLSAATNENKLTNSLFPSIKYLKRRYTYLNKYPFLIIVAWIHRIIDYIFDKKSGNKKDTFNIGNKRIEMLKKYKVIK